ncbi:MAG: nucleotide exchange factor GrpE [Phycisphaerales bacterium]|jgi:molecular chaperone GrpE|nr:nucleotide exchange factor GrpE [Phycisphaerales bacterium]
MMTDTNKTEEQIQPNDEAAQELTEDLTESEQLRQELTEANETKLRALADFKNFQRRSIENETRATNNGIARIVRSILPAIEQMNMAIDHAEDDAVVQGFKMARDGLLQGLSECGVSTIEPKVGDSFDPQKHEAMMRQESDDMDVDHIVMVMQKGFKLGDIVICPAKVSVSS